jgi:hypothetical protein
MVAVVVMRVRVMAEQCHRLLTVLDVKKGVKSLPGTALGPGG